MEPKLIYTGKIDMKKVFSDFFSFWNLFKRSLIIDWFQSLRQMQHFATFMAWTRRSLGKTDHLDKNPSLYLSEAPLIKTLITYKLWALKISDRGLSEVMKLTGSKVRATSINNDFYIFPVVNFYKKVPSVITCQRTSGFWQKKTKHIYSHYWAIQESDDRHLSDKS